MTESQWDTEINDGVITINFRGCNAGWSHHAMLTSDVHFDNAHCNRRLYKQHLDWALTRNAPILDIGDFSCVMQGKWDKRKSEDAMRDEYRGGKYFDKIVNVATDFLSPYAGQFAMMGYGNHETAILGRHETDICERIVEKLKGHGATNLQKGRFAGWVRLRFWHHEKSYTTKFYYYHHGWGGGGPVTRGTIDTSRMAVYVPDAHIVHTGHVHHAYEMPIQRHRLTSNGREYTDEQIHIRTPGYKDEISGGMGWAVERGMAPRPQGGQALEFHCYIDENGNRAIGVRSWRLT